MDKEIASTTEFWNSVSEIYGDSPMTNREADLEMNSLFKLIGFLGNKTVKELICLGAADGSRDPIKILNFLKRMNLKLPKKIIINDISSGLLEVCERKMAINNFSNVERIYVCKPMHEINYKNNGSISMFLVGLYDADYIETAFKLYRDNSEVTGKEFNVSWLWFEGDNLYRETKDEIKFNINEYGNNISKVKQLRENAKTNFLAYSIKTNKNFVTHYYDFKMIKFFFGTIFSDCKITSYKVGNRYLMMLVSKKYYPDCLITSLNNVVGNIPFDLQVASLKNIKKMFF